MQKLPKAGIVVAITIFAFVVSALLALITNSPSLSFSTVWANPYYFHVTKFSFYQSLLSTLLSVGLAIPVAHALFYRRFLGRDLLLKLFSSTLVIPVLVGVVGLLAIYGNSGLLSVAYSWLGLELPFSIYGLNGIVLAHLFFNLPYASRLLLLALESIPVEQHKLSAHLGMGRWHKFIWVEWPRIRQQLPYIAGLVFMLCFTSFATVMALGGGPKSTTIELAIYQAIKFDFELQTGALLALWQMFLCGLFYLVVQRLSKSSRLSSMANNKQSNQLNLIRLSSDSRRYKLWDTIVIALAVMLVLPPLLVVVIRGLNPELVNILQQPQFWSAVKASFSIAFFAAIFSLIAGIAIIQTSRAWRLKDKHHKANGIELIGTIILVTPGLVISTGLFLLLRDVTNVFRLAWLLVIAVNSLMALPYVLKSLSLPMFQIAQRYQYLTVALGMKGLQRFRLIEWRALGKPMAHAFALSFMLSLGDLSAIALFGSQDMKTLPLYLFQLLGSYQMDAAAVVSAFLLICSLSCFALFERIFTFMGSGVGKDKC